MGDNALLDATEYAKTMLLLFKNSLVAGRLVDGQFRNEVTDENGLTINIKRPPQFVAQDGEALTLQPVVNGSTPVVVDQYKNVHLDYGDLESIQSVNQLVHDESMKAAASELAHTIDSAVHAVFPEFASSVGTPGTTIGSAQQFNAVHTQLMDQSVPNSGLRSVVSFNDGELIRGSLIGGDNAGAGISDERTSVTSLSRTRIPILSEIDLFATNNTQSIVAGDRAVGTAIINGAAQNVNYRAVKDTNQQTLNLTTVAAAEDFARGDTFTIAGVFAVNQKSRQVLPYLKEFVVLEDVSAAANAVALTIWPPIIVSGTNDGFTTFTNTAFVTVSAAPANGAAITFSTAADSITPIRVAFHKKAISLVGAKLRTPLSDSSSFISDAQTGIGIRYWRGSDITTGRHIHRWDTVFGVQMLQRELGARVNGT
jgi:hypothetical protein